jgi:GNAT superfamily N-acetyltransferase
VPKTYLHKIAQEDYELVRPIFKELADEQLNVTAILDRSSPGEVYVNDVDHPRTAYMISGDGHYLAGASQNHRFNTALNALLPRDTYFVLFCDLADWESALDVVLKNTYAVRAYRRYHTLEQLKIPDWQDGVPNGFLMQPIKSELLAGGLHGGEDVADAILGEWFSMELFLERGFGFCLVHDSTIVSWCFSDYVSGERCEIGVYTDWNYRRRGLGTLTTAATSVQALARGFSQVGWHCWDNNVGSIGVAEKVGFKRATDYDVFINHWAAENVTDMTQEEFRAFARYYEREFQTQPPISGFPHIVAAKAWALSGDRSGCFRHLNKAIDICWLSSVEQLREIWPEFFLSPDLDEMQEWQDLVKRMDEPIENGHVTPG